MTPLNAAFGVVPPNYKPVPPEPMNATSYLILAGLLVAFLCLVARIAWEENPGLAAAVRDRVARAMVGAAARVAGSRRSYLLDAWLADLAGTPEEGRVLAPAQQVRYGRRCFWAAIRFRVVDVTDDLLRSQTGCAIVVAVPVAAAAVVVMRHGGLMALVTNADKLTSIGGGMTLGIRWLRRQRGVAPALKKRAPALKKRPGQEKFEGRDRAGRPRS